MAMSEATVAYRVNTGSGMKHGTAIFRFEHEADAGAIEKDNAARLKGRDIASAATGFSRIRIFIDKVEIKHVKPFQ